MYGKKKINSKVLKSETVSQILEPAIEQNKKENKKKQGTCSQPRQGI